MAAVLIACMGLLAAGGAEQAQADRGLDPSFGNGGIVTTDFGGPGKSDEIRDIALQPDGKIVAVGHTDQDQSNVARYLPDGKLDPTFGSGGKVTLHLPTADRHAGAPSASSPTARSSLPTSGSALFRLTPDGQLDTGFGTGGVVADGLINDGRSTTFQSHAHVLNDLAIQPDGKIVAVGNDNYATPGALLGSNRMIVRYTANGALDPSFGDRGPGCRHGAQERRARRRARLFQQDRRGRLVQRARWRGVRRFRDFSLHGGRQVGFDRSRREVIARSMSARAPRVNGSTP